MTHHHTTTAPDTICAISTPPGIGGIAVARISGPDAIPVVAKLWKGRPLHTLASHTVHLGTITDISGQPLDQAVATIYLAPHSFTGENVVELSIHGSRYIQRELINNLIAAGARLAQPGEFTRRAFTAGRIGLTEAEAIADVIASNSRAAHRIAISQMKGGISKRIDQLRAKLVDLASLLELELDFSEEEVEFASRQQLITLARQLHTEITRLHQSFTTGNAIKQGIPVAIVGPTNAGKSSLLNALLGDQRAIVSDIHGTTRDTIEETLEIGDYLFRFIDTAGIRKTTDTIEQIGIDRSLQAISKARIILILTDATATLPTQLIDQTLRLTAQSATPPHIHLLRNKIDLTTTHPIHPDKHSAPDITARINTTDPNATEVVETEVNATEVIETEITETEIVENETNTTEANATNIDKSDNKVISVDIDTDTTHLTASPFNISAKTGQGIDQLLKQLQADAQADQGNSDEDILVTNIRHAQALAEALRPLTRLLHGLTTDLPGDLLAQDLRETLHHLSTITGQIPSTEILSTIFSRFCIGK